MCSWDAGKAGGQARPDQKETQSHGHTRLQYTNGRRVCTHTLETRAHPTHPRSGAHKCAVCPHDYEPRAAKRAMVMFGSSAMSTGDCSSMAPSNSHPQTPFMYPGGMLRANESRDSGTV